MWPHGAHNPMRWRSMGAERLSPEKEHGLPTSRQSLRSLAPPSLLHAGARICEYLGLMSAPPRGLRPASALSSLWQLCPVSWPCSHSECFPKGAEAKEVLGLTTIPFPKQVIDVSVVRVSSFRFKNTVKLNWIADSLSFLFLANVDFSVLFFQQIIVYKIFHFALEGQ